ncbi:unnamed protein product [Calypogeia fissa]
MAAWKKNSARALRTAQSYGGLGVKELHPGCIKQHSLTSTGRLGRARQGQGMGSRLEKPSPNYRLARGQGRGAGTRQPTLTGRAEGGRVIDEGNCGPKIILGGGMLAAGSPCPNWG